MASKLLLLIALAWPGLWCQAAEPVVGPAAAASAGASATRERLVWAGAPYAPMVIREGSLRGRGYVDRMLAEVLEPGLPQYSHETLHVSPLRLDRELRESDQAVCSPAFSRTAARATRYAFTGALFRFLPVGVVMRKDHVLAPSRRADLQSLSLQVLLDRGLRLGLVGFRAHGGAVDLMLGAHAAQVQRFVLNTSNQSVLAMLARSHALDATLVYEFELSYFTALQPDLGEQLGWWPLDELDESQLSYVACSANPPGRRAVLAIDRLLAQPGTRERLQALYEHWLDESSRRRLKELRQRLGPLFWRDPRD